MMLVVVSGAAIPVGIDVQVESIDSISEVNMVRSLNFIYIQLWRRSLSLHIQSDGETVLILFNLKRTFKLFKIKGYLFN